MTDSIKQGDLNADGRLDEDDLNLLRELVNKPELAALLSDEDKALLDINNDGVINQQDIVALVNKINMSITSDTSGLDKLRAKFKV